MSQQLSFRIGAETSRGKLSTTGQSTGLSSGQVLFAYNKLTDLQKEIFPKYNSGTGYKPTYDVRIYTDIKDPENSDNNIRIPVNAYFADYAERLNAYDIVSKPNAGYLVAVSSSSKETMYSSKVTLIPQDGGTIIAGCFYGALGSTGSGKYNIGNTSQPIYFKDGIPTTVGFTIDTTSENLGTVGTTLGVYPIQLGTVGTNTIHAAVKIPEAQEDEAGLITKNQQIFNGNKTFTGNIIINSKNSSYIDNFHQCDDLCISGNNQDLRKKLYLDPQSITAIDNTNDIITSSTLYLNGDGGNIGLGPQILISTNKIQSIQDINNSPDNYIFNDLYLNPDGASTHIGNSTPIEITEEGIVKITNETEASSNAIGALIVSGGVGISKTSYVASLLPRTTKSTNYTLGSESYIWSKIYSQYNYLFGSSGDNYTQIKTEDTPSSSVTVTIPNIDGNVTISKTSDFENDGDSVKYYKIPFYTTDYKEIGVNDGFRLWQYKGSTDKADEGISTLTLGNDKPSETENNKYGAVDIYSIDSSYQSLRSAVSETRGVTYLRNYGTSGFLVATAELNTAVGGEAINGDTPVYISETGLATACTGIVINELAQTFKGSKSFSSQMVLTRTTSISTNNKNGALRIGPSDYTSGYSLLFDRTGIQAHDSSRNSSTLNLNANGGDICLGPWSWITPGDNALEDYLFIDGTIETYGDIACGGSISSGNIYPMSHNYWNIGSDIVRWNNIYVSNYVSTGALQLGNTGGSPSTNKTTTIGYGTGNPSSVVSSPEIGRVYFKIIS